MDGAGSIPRTASDPPSTDSGILAPLLDLIAAAIVPDTRRRLLVAVAGPVAVGKSTFASALAGQLGVMTGRQVAVVAADGFLHPNAVLIERGLLDRKGHPETYDRDALEQFLVAAGGGAGAHVASTIAVADVVVTKDPDHGIASVEMRRGGHAR